METKITMLPLEEVKNILDSFTKEVLKVAVMNGDDVGVVIEYVEDRRSHVPVIRPIPAITTRHVCPKCQGLPIRYKLVEDDTIVGAHQEQVMCGYCNGEGQV